MAKKIVLVFPVPRAPSHIPSPIGGRLPFSLLYLARNLGPEYIVEIFDERVDDFDLSRLLESAGDALCVGVTAFTGYQIHAGLDISRKIKEKNRNVPIVWGGWHPTLEPVQTLQDPNIDFAVIGQGEQTFKELVKYFETSEGLDVIKGIAYKRDAAIKINAPRELVNPDSFGPINYDLIDCRKYLYKTAFSEKCIGLFATHGCPFSCGFCSIHKVYGRRWFPKKAQTVINEILYLKKNAGVNTVTFDDDNFFVDKKFTIELLSGFIESKLDINWAANAHSASFLKMADDSFMALIKKSGCSQILIGAETGNEEILKKIIGKHASVEDTYAFVRLLSAWDISPVLSTMVGFPCGDGKDYLDTINMVARCKNISPLLKSMVFFYTPYPGTALYPYAISCGMKPPETLEGWGEHSLFGFRAPWVSAKVRRYVRNFNCFYIYYAHMDAVLFDRNVIKVVLKSILFSIVRLRFKLVFFKFQFDAEIFYGILRILDKLGIIDISVGPWADFQEVPRKLPGAKPRG